jgi:hypothetical protein
MRKKTRSPWGSGCLDCHSASFRCSAQALEAEPSPGLCAGSPEAAGCRACILRRTFDVELRLRLSRLRWSALLPGLRLIREPYGQIPPVPSAGWQPAERLRSFLQSEDDDTA